MTTGRHSLIVIGLNLTLALASCAIAADLALYYQNSLLENGRWRCTKLELAKRPIGSATFYVTHTTLAQNRLNLTTWHGFHEVLYRDPVDLSRIEFDMYIDPLEDNFLSLIYNRTDRGFSGIALRSPEHRQSFLFDASPRGRFTSRTPLLRTRLHSASWNHVAVAFGQGTLTLTINRAEVGRFPCSVTGRQTIGFRLSGNNVDQRIIIDDVVLYDRAGEVLLREPFSNRKHLGRWLTILLAGLLLLEGLIYALARRRRLGLTLLAANLSLVLSLATLYLVYFYSLSGKHPDPESINWHGYQKHVETEQELTRRLLRAHGSRRSDSTYRILFFSASQTFGEGISSEGRSFVKIIEARLNAAHRRHGRRVECINAGVCGTSSVQALEMYRTDLHRLHPDLVVLNMSNMDQDPERFRESLSAFVRYNRPAGIKTLFVLEPRYTMDPEKDTTTYQVMREVARASVVPAVDMAAHMEQHKEEGFLWWDELHMTDLGHELFASKLLEDGLAGIVPAAGTPARE